MPQKQLKFLIFTFIIRDQRFFIIHLTLLLLLIQNIFRSALVNFRFRIRSSFLRKSIVFWKVTQNGFYMRRVFIQTMRSDVYTYFPLILIFVIGLHCQTTPYFEATFYTVEEILSQHSHYCFRPNPGNLGDSLIHYAEFQVFNRLNLSVDFGKCEKLKQPTDIIISGGGRHVPQYWCGKDIEKIIKSNMKNSLIMLPASIRGCEYIIKMFDEKDTVILREFDSYEHCIKLNNRARFIVSNDMAFSLNLKDITFSPHHEEDIPGLSLYKNTTDKNGTIKQVYSDLLIGKGYRMYQNSINNIKNGMKDSAYHLNGRIVRFFLRTDKEKRISKDESDQVKSLDLSGIAGSDSCTSIPLIAVLTKLFIGVADSADIVISDRLHVSIISYLLGKEVYLVDNSYGKLSSVFFITLNCRPNVHLINSLHELPFKIGDLRPIKGYHYSPKLRPYLNLSYSNFYREMKQYSRIKSI